MTAKEKQQHTSSSAKKDKHNSSNKTTNDKIKKRKHVNTSTSTTPKHDNDYNNNTPANKKRALKKQRQSSRRHHADVERAKDIWNKLRIKTGTDDDDDDDVTETKKNERDRRQRLMSELMSLLENKMTEVALQHDASRVVQAAIQFGSTEQRRVILEELCGGGGDDKAGGGGGLAELSKFQYAHFVVLKLIKYCGREERDRRLIVKALRGNFSKLATHSVAARVVELLLATFPPSSTQSLRLEFFGPQAKLLPPLLPSSTGATTSPTNLLTTLLSSSSSDPSLTHEQKTFLLDHVLDLLTKMSQKQLHSFAYYHHLLHDYLTASSSSSSLTTTTTPIETLTHQLSLSDHTLSLLTTRAGTLSLCRIVTRSSAKERRKFLKACKGYAASLLRHDDAYLFVLRLCDIVDDTVMVHRCLLNELLSTTEGGGEEMEGDETTTPLVELVASDTGHKLFLLLLHPEKPTWCFHPFERNDVLSSSSENETNNTGSKKDAMTRRNELLRYVKTALIDVCATNTERLMRSRVGCKVLRGVLNVWGGSAADGDGRRDDDDDGEGSDGVVEEAIIKACLESVASSSSGDDVDVDGDDKNENDNDKENNETTSSLFDDPVAHLFLKQQLRPPQTTTTDGSTKTPPHSPSTTTTSSPSLAKRFHEAFKGRLLNHVATSNRGAFVVAALAESSEEMTVEVTKELLNELKMTKREGKGFEVLMNVLDKK